MSYSPVDQTDNFENAQWPSIDETLNTLNTDYAALQDAVKNDNAVLDLDTAGAVLKCKVVPIEIVEATTETDTDFVFPTKAILLGAGVNVKTQEATGTTKTVDVGLKSVDADGLIDGASVASAGVILPTLLNTGQTLGALLRQDETGSSGFVPALGYSCGGKTLTYSLGSDDFAELVADIIVWYIEVA